ncbi:MAG: PA0069 family radical SAM protein [Opitutales bacterium]
MQPPQPKGRGAAYNPPNRFEPTHVELEPEAFVDPETPEAAPRQKTPTRIIEDCTQAILTRNDSPDINFRYSLNPYRGCAHGCAYCYARPTHEYLGLSAGIDFETVLHVKTEAPLLLEQELSRPSWQPQPVAMSGVTDPYQPLERERQITRGCLEVLARLRHPVMLITKNAGIQRDIDLLAELARWNCVGANLSITTLDAELARKMEPRTASPRLRVETVRKLAEADVPVGVNIGPVIPGLNDVEIPSIVEAAAAAGARWINLVPLRLPWAVKEIFFDWLERHYPGKSARVEQRLRSLRGGKLNDPNHHSRFIGEGPWAEQLRQLLQLGKQKARFTERPANLSSRHFRRPGGTQLELAGL